MITAPPPAGKIMVHFTPLDNEAARLDDAVNRELESYSADRFDPLGPPKTKGTTAERVVIGAISSWIHSPQTVNAAFSNLGDLDDTFANNLLARCAATLKSLYITRSIPSEAAFVSELRRRRGPFHTGVRILAVCWHYADGRHGDWNQSVESLRVASTLRKIDRQRTVVQTQQDIRDLAVEMLRWIKA